MNDGPALKKARRPSTSRTSTAAGVVASYVRVSSRAQSSTLQSHAIARAAAARGDTINRTYEEKTSAKTTQRAELARLRNAARAGELRKLYVYRLDRLARSGIRDTLEILDELRAAGCSVVTVADSFDLEGPGAELVLCVLAWAAKAERLAINERISSAREAMAAKGLRWGRPRTMSPAQRERVAQLRKEGRSIRAIAVAMKVHRSSVERALRAKE